MVFLTWQGTNITEAFAVLRGRQHDEAEQEHYQPHGRAPDAADDEEGEWRPELCNRTTKFLFFVFFVSESGKWRQRFGAASTNLPRSMAGSLRTAAYW